MLWCADSRAYCPFRGRCCVVLCIHTSTLPTATRESVGVCGRLSRSTGGPNPTAARVAVAFGETDASTCDVVSHTHCTCYTS